MLVDLQLDEAQVKVITKECGSDQFEGYFFVPIPNKKAGPNTMYLHSDGNVHSMAVNSQGEHTGIFPTRERAQSALDTYKKEDLIKKIQAARRNAHESRHVCGPQMHEDAHKVEVLETKFTASYPTDQLPEYPKDIAA